MLTKPLTTLSSEELDSSFTLEDMHLHWLACPVQNIRDLFYFEEMNKKFRISTYVVEHEQLNNLFGRVNQAPINFRIHMSANPDIDHGGIKDSIPSFAPIVQLYNTNEPPRFISTNAVVAKSDEDFNIINIPITPEKAKEMIESWRKYLGVNLSSIFQSEGTRINFTTFDNNDSEDIRNAFVANPNADKKLYIHLGYEIPTEKDKPFGFRIILDIFTDDGRGDRAFFEFSNPCPPACIG